jgi:hypothetical protein
MPPCSAKSTYTSILFPPWLLANCDYNILAASHTTELAEKWGRRRRASNIEIGLVRFAGTLSVFKPFITRLKCFGGYPPRWLCQRCKNSVRCVVNVL